MDDEYMIEVKNTNYVHFDIQFYGSSRETTNNFKFGGHFVYAN